MATSTNFNIHELRCTCHPKSVFEIPKKCKYSWSFATCQLFQHLIPLIWESTVAWVCSLFTVHRIATRPHYYKRSMPIRGVCMYAKLTLKGIFNRIVSAYIHVQNQENRHDDSGSCLLLMSRSPFPNLAMVDILKSSLHWKVTQTFLNNKRP